ncbi:oncostatin-M-specific receptor subunit beta [Bufo bufo]|uniref:oncostatin-M-specific receptor subunit beta n=1 Tax=Bufo bufo TaxID=8384 RepID=UPI001ABE77D5|nr:oncostatin-M-specific receptor subunit beta [Bufo bufo]XP_040276885.1 oncostatin-M-specific receptor subunit beta [Bufo bufo]
MSPWKTHHGQNRGRTRAVIYPRDRVVLEGSDVTFCCLPGQDQTVQGMTYSSRAVTPSLDMGTDSYVITVKNVTITKSDGSNVQCMVDKKNNEATPGTVLIVSRLPDKPKNFSCETQDLLSLRCSWNPGSMHNFLRILRVNYVLQEWFSMKNYTCLRDHCDWTIQKNQQMYNFTLTAKNVMGERSTSSIVYLHERVLLLAPSSLRADDVNASHITLTWSLRADYTSLQIHCQVDLQEDLVNLTTKGKLPTEIYRVIVSGLQPYTQYNPRVRCMAASSLAGWSKWSYLVVRTQEDAPAGALDVWRRIDDDDDKRIVTLYWKPSSLFRANGNISHYIIKFWPLEGTPVEREISGSDVNSSRFSIGRQAYAVSVTAHNKAGGSPPAELRIPANNRNGAEQIVVERTYSKDGEIYLSWQQERGARGYVVEWCPAPRSPHCDLQWKKYNSSVQSDVIRSHVFRPGVRYDFRIYESMADGEHLLKKKEGYTEELVSSVKPNVKITSIEPRSMFLDWSPYPTDETQEGFIIGYNVYVTETKEKDCHLEKADERTQLGDFHVCRFYIGDPHKMHIRINGLKPNGKYEVAVVAITGGGETSAEFSKAHTPSDTGAALLSIIVPIITVSVLALILLFLGCWKRAWLKRICLPDIPDPNKSKIFSFPGTKNALNRNILLTPNHEPQMVDIVSIQEQCRHKPHEDPKESSEHQLHEIHSNIQMKEGSECDEDVSESYVPCDDELLVMNSFYAPMNDPSYDSQSLPHLEFFNQNYTSTTDGREDTSAAGYRPQMNTAQVHSLPYTVQSMHSEAGLDNTSICFNSIGYGSEPMSPTSVGSTAFILVD